MTFSLTKKVETSNSTREQLQDRTDIVIKLLLICCYEMLIIHTYDSMSAALMLLKNLA